MLGVLCARPRPWILNSLSLHFNRLSSSLHHHHPPSPRRLLSLLSASRGGHGGLSPSSSSSSLLLHSSPRLNRTHSSSTLLRRPLEPRGEGSWNVAWDARPARWLHRSDSAWLLLGGGGVFACLAPPLNFWPPDAVAVTDTVVVSDEGERRTDLNEIVKSDDVVVKHENSVDNYKVTAVLADGRCLFRAIAHVACMRNGEEAPDEDRQRELADELRAQVVEELLKRREESEWFIEGDFDTYIKRIQQPFVWGGEPELLMASHVLKMKISVYMIDRTSGNLVNIANYGEEYRTEKVKPIKVLFHGYGHYEILETVAEQSCEEVSM